MRKDEHDAMWFVGAVLFFVVGILLAVILFSFQKTSAAVVSSQMSTSTAMSFDGLVGLETPCIPFTSNGTLGSATIYWGTGTAGWYHAQQIAMFADSSCLSGTLVTITSSTTPINNVNDDTYETADYSNANFSLTGYHGIKLTYTRIGAILPSPFSAGDGSQYFYIITDTTPPPPTSSQFTYAYPTDGTIVASTTIPITLSYFALASDTPSTIMLDLYRAGGTSPVSGFPIFIVPTLEASTTYATSTILEDGGTYFMTASMTSPNGRVLAQIGGAAGGNRFSVNTASSSPISCGLTDFGGCLQSFFVWAFFPSQASFDRIGSVWQDVRLKPPFGYLLANVDALKSLNASSSPAFALAAMAPITNTIFHPLDVGLAGILVFAFGLWFLLTVIHLPL